MQPINETLIDDRSNQLLSPQIVVPDAPEDDLDQDLPLGKRLVEAGLIRPDQLDTALAHQESEEERLRALAEQQGTVHQARTQRKPFKRLGEVVAELGLVDESNLLPMLESSLASKACDFAKV